MEAGIHELTAGYALDALDPAEREAFEQPSRGLRAVPGGARLVLGGHERARGGRRRPCPERGAARADPRRARGRRSRRSCRSTSRRRVSPVLAAVTAIAAAVAIGLGIYAISLNSELDDTRSALTAQESAAAVLADPDATTVALQSGSGRARRRSRAASAVLVLDDLPAAPAGKDLPGVGRGRTGSPASAGTFDPTDSGRSCRSHSPCRTAQWSAVTVENAGGASAPTLPMVAASDPV